MSFPNPFDPATSFELPKDKERLYATWWRPAQIQKAWGCSRPTVYRLLRKYRSQLNVRVIWVNTPKKLEIWEVIPANTPRPEPPKGNPAFRDGDQQSRYARIREEKRRKTHPQT